MQYIIIINCHPSLQQNIRSYVHMNPNVDILDCMIMGNLIFFFLDSLFLKKTYRAFIV